MSILAVVVVVVVVGFGCFPLLSALWRVSLEGRAPPGLWRAAVGEVSAFVRIVGWSLGRHAPAVPEDVDIDVDAEVVVVFVHGAMADGSCTTAWQEAVVAAGVGVPIFAPDHGAIVRSLTVHAQRTQAFVARVRRRCPKAALVFVGHSMGGLVIRKMLADDDGLRAATRGVVSVASPHRGTQSMRGIGRLFGAAHLGFQHPEISALPALEQLVPGSVFIASAVDAVVYPKATSLPRRWGIDDDAGLVFSFDELGHAALLVRAEVAERIAVLVAAMVVSPRGPDPLPRTAPA